MTRDELNKLTDKEKRVKIAKVCGLSSTRYRFYYGEERILCEGWTSRKDAEAEQENLKVNYRWLVYPELHEYEDIDALPDYLNDLNACHEMEKTLDSNQRWIYDKKLACCLIDNSTHIEDGWMWHATAAQRADAFLLTVA